MDTHPNTSHAHTLEEPVGLGNPYKKILAATVADTSAAFGPRHRERGYISSQPLPDMEDIPVIHIQKDRRTSPFNGVAPSPYPWVPKFLPEQWVYTDGSDLTGHPRLGASVVHIPSSTTIYTNAMGTEDNRTGMRAELIAIHTALTKFARHDWIGIFTDSLSSLQAIRHRHANPGTTGAKHYHHHMPVLGSITDLL